MWSAKSCTFFEFFNSCIPHRQCCFKHRKCIDVSLMVDWGVRGGIVVRFVSVEEVGGDDLKDVGSEGLVGDKLSVWSEDVKDRDDFRVVDAVDGMEKEGEGMKEVSIKSSWTVALRFLKSTRDVKEDLFCVCLLPTWRFIGKEGWVLKRNIWGSSDYVVVVRLEDPYCCCCT